MQTARYFTMIWSYFLLRHLIFLTFTSVSCLPFELAVQWTHQKGDVLGNQVHESSLEKCCLKGYEEQKSGAISAYESSINNRKGKLHILWDALIQKKTPQTKTSLAWSRYRGIAEEALHSFSVPEAKRLAKAVLELGPKFSHHHHHPQLFEKKIKSIINLTHLVLQIDPLMEAERIWALGILLYLRRQIPADKDNIIPIIWEAKDMNRSREEFLSFLLKDVNVERLVREMWSGFPFQVETGDRDIQEAIQRDSTIHLIKNQMKVMSHHPSTKFQSHLLDFVNLGTPINSEKASSLFQSIWHHLNEKRKPTEMLTNFDEGKNTIRLLLHLEEYHDTTSDMFQISMQESKSWWDMNFHTDIVFQLQDEKLLPEFKTILRDFTKTLEMDRSQLDKVLEVLNHQPTSSSQLARFFRVVNLVLKRNPGIYETLDHALNQHPEMISDLSEMSLKHGIGNINPHWAGSMDLRYFIFRKQEDQMASLDREKLARILIHQGILSEDETGRGLEEMKWNFCGSRKKTVTQTLQTIFKRILDDPADMSKRPELMKYILYLISLKNDDAKLYRHLLVRGSPVVAKLVDEVVKFSEDPSWNKDGTLPDFETALHGLEKILVHVATVMNKNIP
ncbi:hypothetical protein DFH28DRAFT_1102584 [Melampsora americana]|nr:hypothetical protein DFH28DRAFT_1102584 [Melampsora americana]